MEEQQEFKTMQVTKETWLRLSRIKRFPERANFDDVIKLLLDEYEKDRETEAVL